MSAMRTAMAEHNRTTVAAMAALRAEMQAQGCQCFTRAPTESPTLAPTLAVAGHPPRPHRGCDSSHRNYYSEYKKENLPMG